MDLSSLRPWEALLKRVIWRQLGEIKGMKILDFGSGPGMTACYLAKENQVTAIEPDKESINNRFKENEYKGISADSVFASFADQKAVIKESRGRGSI